MCIYVHEPTSQVEDVYVHEPTSQVEDSALFLSLLVSKCYASWCNLYKVFQLHSLKMATGEKEPRPGA